MKGDGCDRRRNVLGQVRKRRRPRFGQNVRNADIGNKPFRGSGIPYTESEAI